MIDLDKIKKWMDSQEGEEFFKEYAEKLDKEENIWNYHLEKINKIDNFESFVESVIKKYGSEKYRRRWLDRGIEPPEDLTFLLFDYVEKYGREATEPEYEKYGNMFTVSMYFYKGYLFNKMYGQGTVINIGRVD
jgi:hypothetical protein